MTAKPPGLKARLIDEAKLLALVFVYLAVLLAVFTNFRRLVLAEYRISYFHYGYSLAEALVLAKVVLTGRYFGFGERFRDRPLIIPCLYKTLIFGVLILAFSVLEHVLVGLSKGHAVSTVVDEILAQGWREILAKVLMLTTALVPMFAFWEVGRVLGEGRLLQLFLQGPEGSKSN